MFDTLLELIIYPIIILLYILAFGIFYGIIALIAIKVVLFFL